MSAGSPGPARRASPDPRSACAVRVGAWAIRNMAHSDTAPPLPGCRRVMSSPYRTETGTFTNAGEPIYGPAEVVFAERAGRSGRAWREFRAYCAHPEAVKRARRRARLGVGTGPAPAAGRPARQPAAGTVTRHLARRQQRRGGG